MTEEEAITGWLVSAILILLGGMVLCGAIGEMLGKEWGMLIFGVACSAVGGICLYRANKRMANESREESK